MNRGIASFNGKSWIIDKRYLVESGTPGADWLATQKPNTRPSVHYALRDRRIVAVAPTADALSALLAPTLHAGPPAELRPARPQPEAAGAPATPADGVELVNDEATPDYPQPARRSGAEYGPAEPARGEVKAPRPFHNPYNFVPFVRRPSAGELRAKAAPGGDAALPEAAAALCDGTPPGHHRWRADRLHGRLVVELTLATPMLLPEASEVVERGNGHKIFPVLTRDGRPWIPPTSLKGALRASFEAITNSRFPRFDRHDARLGYRRPAADALKLKGFRVEQQGNQLRIDLYEVASLRYYPTRSKRGENIPKPPIVPGSWEQAKHGDAVWVKIQTKNGLHRVQSIVLGRPKDPTGWEPGFAHVTGQDINRKHCERVFIRKFRSVTDGAQIATPRASWDDRAPDPRPVSTTKARWDELIADYRDAHTDAELWNRTDNRGRRVGPERYLGRDPGQTAWSAHIWDKEPWNFGPGAQGYARLDSAGQEIVSVYPVLISRDLFPVAPGALLPADMRPALTTSQMSPADRVFGWVPEQRGRDGALPPYRGHVRISAGECQTANAIQSFPGDGLPLAILGAPKPRQARFYVGRGDGTAQADGLTRLAAGYANGKLLRGRKVYPHHRGLPTRHWQDPTRDDVAAGETNAAGHRHFREYRRAPGYNTEVRDSQNRSVRGWIRPGATFRFTVDLDNIAEVELGALLTLLHTDPGWYLRLGGGKPLGFGSASARVVGGAIQRGDERADRYRSLLGPTQTSQQDEAALNAEIVRLKQRFIDATQFAYGERPLHLEAARRAAEGFADTLPVHYPRTVLNGSPTHVSPKPNPEGESYRWFVENDRERGGAASYGFALPDLVDDVGLPVLVEEEKRR